MVWLALWLGASTAQAQGCLPQVKVPAEWVTCVADSDCRVTGDGCRSCGALPPVVNKKHHEDYTKTDNALRQKAGCVLACEACGTSHIKVRCVAGRCEGKR